MNVTLGNTIQEFLAFKIGVRKILGI